MKPFFNHNVMKYILSLISGLSVIFCCQTGSANALADNQTKVTANQAAEKTLTVISSPDLYNLTSTWAREFNRLNPSVNITVDNFTDNRTEAVNSLWFLSNEYPETVNDETKWRMVIGHDAIVPVINAKNLR